MQQYPLVTIVGGSGFVGRHLVKLLASKGYRIRVLVRDCIAAEHLKTSATVGQIAIEHADVTQPETLAGKFAGSDAVINLTGILYQSGRQKFVTVHTAGAKAIAAEAKKAGARCLVHVSALGADKARDTLYGASKLAGEQAVREAFPEATILRPSLLIGPDDSFFQRFARMTLISPALPLIGGGHTHYQPLLVTDLTQVIYAALTRPDARGKTYELGGPQTYSFRALMELMLRLTKRETKLVSIPAGIAKFKAFFFELMPFAPPITRDQVKLLAHDNVVSGGAHGCMNLGVAPASIESVLPQYLARYVKE